jgi:hypothetical protein
VIGLNRLWGQKGANGSDQLIRIVQSGSLCADVVTVLSLAMYLPIRVETCRDHRSRSTIFGEHAETPRNAHLRTVNPLYRPLVALLWYRIPTKVVPTSRYQQCSRMIMNGYSR